jgi:putative transposase
MGCVFRPKEAIEVGGRQYLFEAAISLAQIVALDPVTGEKAVLDLAQVRSLEPTAAANVAALDSVDADRWKIAKSRFQAIQPLLSRGRSRTAYRDAAAKANVNPATVYRWRTRFLRTGLLSSLLPEKPGVTRGTKRLSDSVELIVTDLIESVWMKDPKIRFADIYDTLKERCIAAKLEAPHENTVRNRLAEYVERRRRQFLELDPLVRPLGSLTAEYPLEIVQMDHTLLDVFVVDEEFRLPLGRPWLTVAIDVATRIILAFNVSFDPPSANAVGICLYTAVMRKESWARDRSLEVKWPIWGVPSAVYADNGKEFRGEMLRRVCEEYGITLQWRPVRKPRWGGHIERLMGEFAKEMKKLPGATFSNPKERGTYKSEKQAVLTLRELERYLASLVCDTYHNRVHTGIGKTPLQAWQEGTIGPRGIGIPRMIPDEQRFRRNLLPPFERTIGESGVVIDHIHYFSDALRPYVGAVTVGRYRRSRKFTFRRDPRDISVLYFQDPEAQSFLEVPYRDLSRPSVSIWELRAAAEQARKEGRNTQDEQVLFEAVQKRRELVADATKKTKQVRRENELRRHRIGSRPKAIESKSEATPADLNSVPVRPPLYANIRLT